MKRNMKSVITVLLALVMTLCMAQSAFAQNIAISNAKDSGTYMAYKVLDATDAGDGNFTFAVNAAFADFFGGESSYSFDANRGILKDGELITGDAEWTNTNSTETAALAAALSKFAQANGVTGIEVSKEAVDAAPGLYVVVQTVQAEGEGVIATKPILVDLTADKTGITLKDDEITLDKKIVEGKDEKNNDIVVDKNDVNIGDDVNYKITTKIPTYEADVDQSSLKFELVDTFSDGLTYNDDLAIEGFTAGTDYTATYADQVLTITFTPEAIVANAGKGVVARYSAVLNENAELNETGNPNEVELNYTHNPNQKDDYKKLEDETVTYTYGFGIHKVEPKRDVPDLDLPDAEFQIRAEGSDEPIKFVKSTVESTDKDGNTIVTNVYTKATEEQIASGGTTDTVVSSDSGRADVEGLDEGTYTITETKAPDQYTKLAEDIVIKIDAVEGADGLPTGKADLSMVSTNATIEDETTGEKTGEATLEGDEIKLNVYVENVKGINLPETGATSAMFCMIGGIAILLLAGLYYEFAVRRAKDVK